MKILVAVKQVAALDEDFEIRPDELDVEADFLLFDLNEWDDYSLETAMQVKEASATPVEVVVVSVGPERVDESLRKCLAKGADRAIRIWDDSLETADPFVIAQLLAGVVKKEAPDLVFAGVQSSDHAHGSTGIGLAGLLGWPHAAVVNGFDYTPGNAQANLQRELEGGLSQSVQIQCPAVLTIQLGIKAPRYASLRGIKQAAAKPIDLLALADLGLAPDIAATSLSRVRRMYIPPKGRAEMIEGTPEQQAARLADIIREFKGA